MNKQILSKPFAALLVAGTTLLGSATAYAHEPVTRLSLGDPKLPIASAVTVPPGYTTTFLSGNLPDVANPDAPKGTVEAYGNTETQTASVLKKLGSVLESQGLTYGDVVMAHVYLVGDPAKNGEIDFAGMNAAFSKVFGSETQPNKPARSTVKVAGLVLPGALVEIDMIAVRAIHHEAPAAEAAPAPAAKPKAKAKATPKPKE